MNSYRVTRVVDGDTFDVTPQWQFEGQTGSRVRPVNYDASELSDPGGHKALLKLRSLILGKTVQLDPIRMSFERLLCHVYFNGRELHTYFPEYK